MIARRRATILISLFAAICLGIIRIVCLNNAAERGTRVMARTGEYVSIHPEEASGDMAQLRVVSVAFLDEGESLQAQLDVNGEAEQMRLLVVAVETRGVANEEELAEGLAAQVGICGFACDPAFTEWVREKAPAADGLLFAFPMRVSYMGESRWSSLDADKTYLVTSLWPMRTSVDMGVVGTSTLKEMRTWL